MSREVSIENTQGEPAEGLEIIKEEETPKNSAENLDTGYTKPSFYPDGCCMGCRCVHFGKPPLPVEEVEQLLKQKEEELTAKFENQLQQEIESLKERAEFILQNEQVRASYMLREAHRERQEKIGALQTQLSCKNLAGLMYVMCAERKRSKMEKLAIIEEYTSYILQLQDILAEAQSLILNLSAGFKTASRVDNEWREKMKKTLMEFQMFIQDFAKGAPECNQYFLDLPKMLSTEAPLIDNIADYPCTCDCVDEELLVEKDKPKKEWFERLEEDKRPFVIFGDMADFKPPQRRETLKSVKKVQSVPKKWKEYVFHNMFVSADCCNADAIKDEYMSRSPAHWECTAQPDAATRVSTQMNSPTGRRATAVSIDIRGGMGSILKMITSTNGGGGTAHNKALLLGARDSMEIASTTKLREKHRQSECNKVVIDVRARRTSFYPTDDTEDSDNDKPTHEPSSTKDMDTLEEDVHESSASVLGSIHNDSLTMIQTHRPDLDAKIHYEKVCPIEKCQRLQVDSFVRSLPAYMRASPFHHFEQTLEDYEACSPEQLKVLRQRIEEKKKREKAHMEKPEENPLDEWRRKPDGVGVQTSELSMSLPPCSCRGGPNATPVESNGQIFNVSDLLPMKQVLNQINKDCFYDNDIEFNRFGVVGQEIDCTNKSEYDHPYKPKSNRLLEVTRILKQHPSLLDIFQANAV